MTERRKHYSGEEKYRFCAQCLNSAQVPTLRNGIWRLGTVRCIPTLTCQNLTFKNLDILSSDIYSSSVLGR